MNKRHLSLTLSHQQRANCWSGEELQQSLSAVIKSASFPKVCVHWLDILRLLVPCWWQLCGCVCCSSQQACVMWWVLTCCSVTQEWWCFSKKEVVQKTKIIVLKIVESLGILWTDHSAFFFLPHTSCFLFLLTCCVFADLCVFVFTGRGSVPREWRPAAKTEGGCGGAACGHQRSCSECHQEETH